jgi:hypothetical protein
MVCYGKANTEQSTGDKQQTPEGRTTPAAATAIKKNQKKTMLELELNDDGEPMLGDPEEIKGADREKVVRSFVSHHYRMYPVFYCVVSTVLMGGCRRGNRKQKVSRPLAGVARQWERLL